MNRVSEILLLDEVEGDLKQGWGFYENRQQGIGDYFWDSLISDIESLRVYAGVHEKHFGLYRMLSKRFPYAIYYEFNESVAYVIAVLPMKKIHWFFWNN